MDQRHRPVAWLADRLNQKVQRINNWRTRGVPAAAWPEIARAVGTSVDQLVSDDTMTSGKVFAAWPFEAVEFTRFNALTEREKGVVEEAVLEALERLEARRDIQSAAGLSRKAAARGRM